VALHAQLQMKSANVPSPLSINNHTQAAPCQYYDSHLAYYYSNHLNNYEINPSPLVLDASTAYKWSEHQEETYSKQQLSMICDEMEPENCSLNTEGKMMLDISTTTATPDEFSTHVDQAHHVLMVWTLSDYCIFP
jgi:hypothetical protein